MTKYQIPILSNYFGDKFGGSFNQIVKNSFGKKCKKSLHKIHRVLD